MGSIPKHIAIIMDGNGRWAKERGLPRLEGHHRGVETVDSIVAACQELGVLYLTLYAFSEENWLRPREEVEGLMSLLKEYLVIKREKMVRDGVRFETIGDISKLPLPVQEEIAQTKTATFGGKSLTLILALSYGARDEMVRAVNRLLRKKPKKVTEQEFIKALDTAPFPDPDLFIRTSGEKRISNFLLWQLEYTELYFTDTLWPDFDKKALEDAVQWYQNRERRFGKTSEQVQ